MSFNGEHLICGEHEKERYYCTLEKEWKCIYCELEK